MAHGEMRYTATVCQICFCSTDFTGCGKNVLPCHSERSEESLFDLTIRKKQGEILRFAQNDSALGFPQPVQPVEFHLILACLRGPGVLMEIHRLKSVLLRGRSRAMVFLRAG